MLDEVELEARYREQLSRDRDLALGLAAVLTGAAVMAATITTSAVGTVTGAGLLVAGTLATSGRLTVAGRGFAAFMRWWLDPNDGDLY